MCSRIRLFSLTPLRFGARTNNFRFRLALHAVDDVARRASSCGDVELSAAVIRMKPGIAMPAHTTRHLGWMLAMPERRAAASMIESVCCLGLRLQHGVHQRRSGRGRAALGALDVPAAAPNLCVAATTLVVCGGAVVCAPLACTPAADIAWSRIAQASPTSVSPPHLTL